MNQAISIFDVQRVLLGDDPPLFYFEILFRTVVIYGYALALLRWLGSRTVGQLSTVEFLLVIALGSAVGDGMFYPDVPLLHALFVVTILVGANKLLDLLIARFKTAERVIDGVPEEVIRDGVLCKTFLQNSSMGSSELFQQLRERGIEHLGQVFHAYIEADGGLTLYRTKNEAGSGLPVVPPWEIENPVTLQVGQQMSFEAPLACRRCGTVVGRQTGEQLDRCEHCGNDTWTVAQSGTRFAS